MTTPAPIFASEAKAARLLDMKPAEFRALVEHYAGEARQIMFARAAKKMRDGG